ncbi:ulp1 protease family, C-terminal catalytic domain-containing protein [Tanacetum coccineum]
MAMMGDEEKEKRGCLMLRGWKRERREVIDARLEDRECVEGGGGVGREKGGGGRERQGGEGKRKEEREGERSEERDGDTELDDIIQRKESKKKATNKAPVKKIDKKSKYSGIVEADWLFDIGFLSLFFSIFGQGNKDESLVKECTGFSASDKFSGPVLLLVLIYVNSTISKKVKVEKTVPAFKAWNSNLLLKRQQEELDLKGFGLLPIVKHRDNHDETNGDNDDIDEDDDDENDDNDENDENIRNEKEKKNVDEGNKEEVGSENVKDDKVEEKDENVEEEKEKKEVPDYRVCDKTKTIVPFFYYHDYDINDTQSSTEDVEYNVNVSGVTHVIDEVNVPGASNAVDSQESLKSAHGVPPIEARPSFNKLMFKLKRDSDGKVYAKKINDVPCSEDKGSVNSVEVPHQKVINVAKDKTVHFKKKEVLDKINAKVTVKRSAKVVDVPPDKVVDAAKKKLATMTQFKHPRPATKIIKDDYQTPKKGRKRVAQVLEEDLVLRGKRMVNPLFALVSPYFERKTMYTKPFTVAENKIVEYIWSYNSPEGLYPKIQLSSNIIDLWSTILNDEEKYRGKQSVTRNIYCSTGMVEAKKKNFNDVHLVFFPCIKLLDKETSNHYYLICFNMMTAEIDIIDNIHNDVEDLELRYGPYAMGLINTFIDYLGYKKHPKVDAFFSAIPKILRMTWRTTKNAVDCGLFVMRHMEMYNGSGVWINNMKNEKQGQKSQINFFRAKYLAKILLLPYNASKEELLKEANEKWKKQQNKSNTVTNMDVKADKNLMKKFNETLQKANS